MFISDPVMYGASSEASSVANLAKIASRYQHTSHAQAARPSNSTSTAESA
jgi:hypothetical protein